MKDWLHGITVAFIATAMAAPNFSNAAYFRGGPMAFRLASAGGTDGMEWIVADGEISTRTPNEFREFLVSKKIRSGARYEVFLNSPGGDLFGGIELGQAIREYGFGTRIARSVLLFPDNKYPFETDAPGKCYSACAFSFIGGKWRTASDRSLGVHQHYIAEALSTPYAKLFSAADISRQQMIEGILANYVVKMGVDARLLTRAAMTTPSDMHEFSSDA